MDDYRVSLTMKNLKKLESLTAPRQGLGKKRKLNGIYERSPGGGVIKTPDDVLNLTLG